MTLPFSKLSRVRLEVKDYEALHQAILRRDRWCCQFCGGRMNLQVHHIEARSHLGSDAEENLITLCARCHESLHRRKYDGKAWIEEEEYGIHL